MKESKNTAWLTVTILLTMIIYGMAAYFANWLGGIGLTLVGIFGPLISMAVSEKMEANAEKPRIG